MSRGLPRVLYVPNESGDLGDRGPRRALGGLLDAGLVEDVRIVSLLHRVRVGDGSAERARVVEIVRDFKPTIILLTKPAGTGLCPSDINAWRSAANFVFIVADMDAYHWRFKPLPPEAKAVAPYADVVFVPGTGMQRRNYSRAGARDVRWNPATYDPHTFGRLEIASDTVTRDVVMIGNSVMSRFGRLWAIPGAYDRSRLAIHLQQQFGSRFGLFGSGWAKPIGLGPLPFLEQESAIRSAWVTANWDHFPNEPNCSSNRLPISLASGTVHFTTAHPGYSERFRDLPFLRLVRRPMDMIPAIRSYLDTTTPSERIEHARQARAFAAAHFRQDINFVEMLNAVGARIDPIAAERVFLACPRMLTEE